MIEPTLDNFRLLFPEFDQVADVRIQLYIDDAIDEMSKKNWGNCWGKAVLYYAAHNLQLSNEKIESKADGEASVAEFGKLSSANAGGLSVGFAQSPSSAGSDYGYWLSLTSYGIALSAFANACLPRLRLVAC